MRLLPRVLILMAAAPGSAMAATVRVEIDPDNTNFANVVYAAVAGEANRATFTGVDAETIRVADSGATIAASGDCSSVDAHTALCTTAARPRTPDLLGARVTAGDLDDVITAD